MVVGVQRVNGLFFSIKSLVDLNNFFLFIFFGRQEQNVNGCPYDFRWWDEGVEFFFLKEYGESYSHGESCSRPTQQRQVSLFFRFFKTIFSFFEECW